MNRPLSPVLTLGQAVLVSVLTHAHGRGSAIIRASMSVAPSLAMP